MSKKTKVQLSKYGIGVDVGSKNFQGCVRSQDVEDKLKVVATRKFDNTLSGYKAFCVWINRHRKHKSLPYQILMEVTGVYHENLLYYLYDQDLEVCLVMPKRVKRFLQSIGQYSKTDKLDSKGIAQMACERKLSKWKPASKHIRELRTLIRHRKSLVTSKTQFENRMHAIKHSSVEGSQVELSLKQVINSFKQQIKHMDKEVLQMAKQDKELYDKVDMIVNSMPGAGLLSVLTMVAETNGFGEFGNIKQLESYAGFDVIENSSGKYQGKTKISKRGNIHLRTATYMSAVSIVGQKSKPFYNLYERVVKRSGGIKKKGLTAVQRKLLVLIYILWKKNERFDPDYELKKHKEKEDQNKQKVITAI